MYRVIAAALAVASCASVAQAQSAARLSTSLPPFTLERALTAAGVSSPSIEAAQAGVRTAGAARRVAGLRPNPFVQVEVENLAGTGGYKGTRSSETTVSMGLPLELGGKRGARIAVADSRTRRAQIEAAIASADLAQRVTEAYVAAAAAEDRLEIARQQLEFANNGFRAASARVTAGAASPIEQQRADVLRVNAGVDLDKAVREVDVARKTLGLLIGQPVAGPLDAAWFDRSGGYGPRVPASAEGTLTLAAAEADLKTARAQVGLARAQRVPDLVVSAGARRLAATRDTAAVVGVSIPFPVFNSGAAAVSQARAEEQQAEARRRLAVLDTEQQIARAEAELANAAAAARAAGGPALTAANEAARIARLGYGQGKFSQLELLDAERTLSDTREAFIDALSDFHNAEAQLARLTTPAPIVSGR